MLCPCVAEGCSRLTPHGLASWKRTYKKMRLTPPRVRPHVVAWIVALLPLATPVYAAPSLTGQNGLIAMPDGRIEEEGLWSSGYSYAKPYSSIWSSIVLFPWLEATGTFTRTAGFFAP